MHQGPPLKLIALTFSAIRLVRAEISRAGHDAGAIRRGVHTGRGSAAVVIDIQIIFWRRGFSRWRSMPASTG
jgi:hypothetical protein